MHPCQKGVDIYSRVVLPAQKPWRALMRSRRRATSYTMVTISFSSTTPMKTLKRRLSVLAFPSTMVALFRSSATPQKLTPRSAALKVCRSFHLNGQLRSEMFLPFVIIYVMYVCVYVYIYIHILYIISIYIHACTVYTCNHVTFFFVSHKQVYVCICVILT